MTTRDFLVLLGALSLVLGFLPIVLSARLRGYVDAWLASAESSFYKPRVTVVLPCKGLDPGFEENARAILDQDYPEFEVLFVTATREDPAHVLLERLLAGVKPGKARLLCAGLDDRRAEKLNNLLHGISCATSETEVFVFVDSDIRPDSGFLGRLVAPLADEEVGATTGIRWYMPSGPRAGSIIQSIWAAGEYPLLANPAMSFVWGGANAIRRATFRRCDMERRLAGALSDSFALTAGVREAGLKILFVPNCVVLTHEDATISQAVEWTNRQTVISRVYNPGFWCSVFGFFGSSNLLVLLGFGVLIGAVTRPTLLFPAALLLSPIVLQMVNALYLLPAVRQLLPGASPAIRRLTWHYVLLAPITSLLVLWNLLNSLTTRRIVWRGVTYELISPTRTRVIRNG